MDRLPVFLKLDGKRCLVVGGGVVAERKVRLLLRTGAAVTVLAPHLTERLQEQADAGDLQHTNARYGPGHVRGHRLVVAATDDLELNRRIAEDADNVGCLCNVVDDNESSEFIFPAIVDRSPVVVAIGTNGTAPVLAQTLKTRIEGWLPGRIGELAEQAGRWRDLARKRFATLRQRRRFWQRFFDGPIADHLLAGRTRAAETAMRLEMLGDAGEGAPAEGEGWIVGAGPGDPGLLTLRAQQLLSRADVVLYDRLVSKQVLDYARKEADLVFVGKSAGRQTMPQADINSLLVKLVAEGKRVCRLKGGDPMVFGRGAEEAAALAEAGLSFQIVPGITAAIGCAAYAGIPLTLRGVSGSVTLATARLDSDLGADWPSLLRSGHTLSLYMGVNSAADIVGAASREGIDPKLPAAIVENGTTRSQRVVVTTIGSLEHDVRTHRIRPPAMIFLGESVSAAEQLQWFDGGLHSDDFPVDAGGQSLAAAVSSGQQAPRFAARPG